MALKKEERESQLWSQQHRADEANMGTVPNGDIELQDHEPGYCSVHTEHIMGRHFGTCQLALMPQWWCNKVRIVDHHKHYNNSWDTWNLVNIQCTHKLNKEMCIDQLVDGSMVMKSRDKQVEPPTHVLV